MTAQRLRAIRTGATIAPILSGRTAVVDIEAVNLNTGEVTDTMGNVGQVTGWVDADGNRIESAQGAAGAVAYVGCRWWSIDIRKMQTVSVH